MILVDAIFSVYKYIDITVIFIASLFILWLSSICSGQLKLATHGFRVFSVSVFRFAWW